MKARRSLLFVPGSRPERFDKAAAAGADMVCIDLEDAVLPAEKSSARDNAFAWASAARGRYRAEIVVRINSLRTLHGLRDLQYLIDSDQRDLTLMLPKVESATDLHIVDELLAGRDMDLIALIESPGALLAARDIAGASPRLSALMLGAADLCAQMNCEMSWDALVFARGQLVAAANARQLDLIDVPYLDVNNAAGLTDESRRVRALGFTAKAAIHPAQVDAINAAFTPSPQDIQRAETVLAAFAAQGGGACLVDGKLVDSPILLSMRRIKAVADTLAGAAE